MRILEIIFPNTCVGCNSVIKDEFCSVCDKKIDYIDQSSTCIKCGGLFYSTNVKDIKSSLCIKCIRGDYSFIKCRSIAKHNGHIKELLHNFKYRKKIILGKILSKIVVDNFPGDFDYYDTVVPVPQHIKKLRERDYNQSAILAKNISKRFEKKYDPFSLSRYKAESKPQYQISNISERKRNVRGVFKLSQKNKLFNKSVLLVDDVFTTGSTINECSKVLISQGVKKVQAITVTRASI